MAVLRWRSGDAARPYRRCGAMPPLGRRRAGGAGHQLRCACFPCQLLALPTFCGASGGGDAAEGLCSRAAVQRCGTWRGDRARNRHRCRRTRRALLTWHALEHTFSPLPAVGMAQLHHPDTNETGVNLNAATLGNWHSPVQKLKQGSKNLADRPDRAGPQSQNRTLPDVRTRRISSQHLLVFRKATGAAR